MWRLGAPLLLIFVLLAGVAWTDRPLPRADLTYVDSGAIQTVDPVRVSYTHDMRVCYALYEGLLRWDNDTFETLPGVAERWEVSDDARTYTFHLRESARWSTGDPVTADDFVRSWRRALLPDLSGPYAKMFFLIEGAEEFFLWRAAELEAYASSPDRAPEAAAALWRRTEERFAQRVAIRAIDERTLVVTLARPTPYFLDLVCFVPFLPVHPATVGACASLDAATGRLVQRQEWTKPPRHVGNGPMRLDLWRFKRDFRLSRSPTYWDQSAARVNSVSILAMENPNTAVLAFESGAVDWVTDADRVEFISDLLESRRRGRRDDIHSFPTFGTYFWSFCCAPSPPGARQTNPFADARLRRALALATDKHAIVDKVRRLGEPVAGSLVPPGSIAGYTPPEGLPFDPAGAAALFAEAGWIDRDSDGRPENEAGEPFPVIEMLCSTGSYHEDIALALAEMWGRALGVRARVISKEVRAYREDLNRADFMCARAGWYGDYGDPLSFLDTHLTGDGNNTRRYSDPEFDGLLARAADEPDPATRFLLLEQAERILVERDLPVLPLFHYVQFTLFHEGRLSNYSMHPRLVQHIWELEPVR